VWGWGIPGLRRGKKRPTSTLAQNRKNQLKLEGFKNKLKIGMKQVQT